MKTSLHPSFRDDPEVAEAETILRSCVHCGFCTATCPTYLELGDERDGPRGRIYLIKQLLEEGEASEKTRTHLDRCLTCRACETTCPSDVRYGRLLDIGRHIVERQQTRPLFERSLRRALLFVLPYPRRFGPLLKLGQLFRPLLPGFLKRQVPRRQSPLQRPSGSHTRVVIALSGCAQASATPNTGIAAARVLDRLGIAVLEPPGGGCCGAMSHHLAEPEQARRFARRNIDAWWPAVEAGAEAVVVSASGCGTMVKDYGELLAGDERYAARAETISSLACDLSELIESQDLSSLTFRPVRGSTAVHCPCSLQHGQQLPGSLDRILARAGIELAPTRESHLCCGSAGTYSLLQPGLSDTLLENKLAALAVGAPARIVTANVGCQLHLASRASVPVQHWIELLDEACGDSLNVTI